MPPRTRLPVDGPVVVALYIVLDLFELGVVSYPPYLLDAHLGQVVAYGEKLVPVQHEERRVNLHVFRTAQCIAAFHKADGRTDETADVSEGIHTALCGDKTVTDGSPGLRTEPDPVVYVASLEHRGSLIDDGQPHRERIFTFQMYPDLVPVAVGEAVRTISSCIHPPAMIKQQSVSRNQENKAGPQQLCRREEQREDIAEAGKQRQTREQYIKPSGKIHSLQRIEELGRAGVAQPTMPVQEETGTCRLKAEHPQMRLSGPALYKILTSALPPCQSASVPPSTACTLPFRPRQ